jgi:signal transduction histidine kinase
MRGFSIWLIFCMVMASLAAHATPRFSVIDLDRVQLNEGLFLGRQLAFWENRGEPKDPAAVFEGQFDGEFQNALKDVPGPAYIQGELWLRLVIHNPEPLPRSLILESRYALTDWLVLYQKDLGGRLQVDIQGDRNEQRTEAYPFRSPAFSLMAYPGENVYYLRSQSRGPNILSLYLWREAGFQGHRFVDTLVIGGLFGFIVALFFYNSFLAFSLRSRTYAFYSCFLFSMILLQFSMQNIWPYLVQARWAAWLDNEGYVVIGSVTTFTTLLVTIAFLSMRKNLPRMRFLFQWLLLFSLIPIALSPFFRMDALARIVGVSVGLGSLAAIMASVMAMIRGYRPAAYYLVASVSFLVANMLLTCNLLGIYHTPHVIQYGNFLGVVVQGLLISFAIGHRVQFIRDHADKVIRDLNQELQNHLAQVEALVAERTDTIRTILDNVASGFVIVNPEGRIVKGFSRSCLELLGQDLQEGQLLADVLAFDAPARKIWNLAWSQILDDFLPNSVSLAQLPSSIKRGERSLHLEGKVLRDVRGQIQNLLFTIQDVSELKRQKRQARRHRVLIKILQDLEAFRQFIQHSYDFIARLKNSSDKREQAFLLHTLKGNCMVFGLNRIARHLHQLEDSRRLTSLDIATIENLFRDFLEAHESILKTAWSPFEQNETRVSPAQFQELQELIEKQHHAALIQDVASWVQDVQSRPIGLLVQPMVDNARMLAQRLNRRVKIQTLGADVKVRSVHEERAIEFLVHIIRNAIVHGMDEDRKAMGKSPEGTIKLEFQETPDDLRMIIIDDGRGFDRHYWEEKAREFTVKSDAVISRLPWVDLVELVSRGGHSTQDKVNMEAGRGVGLEGVIQAIRELGGSIQLETESGRGCTVSLIIKRQREHVAA